MFDDEDGVVELLTLEKRMDIVEKDIQLENPVSVRDNDGQFTIRAAFSGLITSARFYRCSASIADPYNLIRNVRPTNLKS